MDKIFGYISEAKDELLNKVTWPTWAELQQYAVVVLLAALIISLMVVLMDVGCKYGLQHGLYKILS